MYARLLIVVLLLVAGACRPYQKIETGSNRIGDFTIRTSHSWAEINTSHFGAEINPYYIKISGPTALWTRDGLTLNELIFYAPLEDGRPMFEDRDDDHPYPVYRADMIEADIQELIEDSVARFFNSGPVTLDRIAPRPFAGADGFEMELSFAAKWNDLEYRALATGAQIGGRLYLVLYIAPRLHYFDAHLAEVRAIVDGISIGGGVASSEAASAPAAPDAEQGAAADPDEPCFGTRPHEGCTAPSVAF